jgi:exodeoxyribonuclease VIII
LSRRRDKLQKLAGFVSSPCCSNNQLQKEYPTMMNANLPFDEYQSIDARNWSALKHMSKTPAHYQEAIQNPPTQSPAMLIGSAFHALVLEPDSFDDFYAVAPAGIDRRTKAGKEAWAEFEASAAGKTILTADQDNTVRQMAAAVLRHPTASRLLSMCGQRELSVTWTDEATGTPCKCRIDAYNKTNGLVIDLKTTDDASPTAFSRTCAKYAYHGQAAYYLDGLANAGAYSSKFIFIVVEKSPPFAVAVFLCDKDMLDTGRLRYQECLRLHAECSAADNWPGYPEEVQTITLPIWA